MKLRGFLFGALLCASSIGQVAFAQGGDDALISEFNRLVREYRFPEALEVLNQGVQAHPDNPVFPMQLVSFQATIRGYVEGQEKILKDEYTRNPGRALRAAQRILTVQPAHSLARRASDELADEVSRKVSPLLSTARDQLQRGDLDAGRDTLEELLALDPLSPQVRSLLTTLESMSETSVRKRQDEVRQVLARIELANGKNSRSPRKSDLVQLQRSVEKALVQRPGDQGILALAQRASEVLAQKGGKEEGASRQALAATVAANRETLDQQFNQGRRLLAEGHFAEAESLFSKLTRTASVAKVAEAYVFQGIARLASVTTADVSLARQLQLKARASFVNALRFDPAAILPTGYDKFAQNFAEARQVL